MNGFVDGFLTLLVAGLFAVGIGLIVGIIPVVLDKIFTKDPPPINTGPALVGFNLAIVTVVIIWPILSWLWWPQ